MKKLINEIKLQGNAILNYFKRYWIFLAISVIAASLLIFITDFHFIAYGLLRLTCVVGSALLVRNVFLTSVDKYIDDGDFSSDFENLEPVHKVYISIGAGLGLGLISLFCFTL